MSSLAEIRTALAATLKAAVPELHVYETVPESVNIPAAIVVPRSTDFERAFGRGLDSYAFDVIVLVSRADDRLAQSNLDPYITGAGTSSIRQAIWDTRALGIGVEARVTGMAGYGDTLTFGTTDYFGARLTVEVLTSGTA